MDEEVVIRRQRVLSIVLMATSSEVVGGALIVRHLANDARAEFMRVGGVITDGRPVLGRIDDLARLVSMLALGGAVLLALATLSLFTSARGPNEWR